MGQGYQTKNYQTPGGAEMHIGGKLVFDTGGLVENLPLADDTSTGGVIADAKTEADTLEAKIGEDGKLYVELPAATGAALGGVIADAATVADTLEAKIGEDNKLYVALPNAAAAVRGGVLQMPAQADSAAAALADLVTDFNTLLAALRTAGMLASE